MNTQVMSDLARIAFFVATMSAAQYLRKHNISADDSALETAVKSSIKAHLDQALSDAKDAINCGMHEAAVATFKASMALAGIEAAKGLTQ